MDESKARKIQRYYDYLRMAAIFIVLVLLFLYA